MNNLHLKNLNIDHTKTKIKYLLNSIKTKNSIIDEFKKYYINDLYNKDYDTEHLTEIADYQDYYGYECFQHNTIITIKGIKI